MAEPSVTETGIESFMLNKARRLVAAGAVTELGGGTFRVRGDNGDHKLAIIERTDEDGEKRSDIACSCFAGGFGNGCSHRLTVELYLQRKRRAA